MQTVFRSVIVPYSCEQMFALVAGVAEYPDFMPWCSGTRILQQDEHGMRASVGLRFAGVSQQFTTQNRHEAPNYIHMTLVDGPFSILEGSWRFTPIDAQSCKVVFQLRYAFNNKALALVIGPLFNRVANSFVDAFTARARVKYGSS